MRSDDRGVADFFRCTQCGECCRGFGGTYVSDADIEAIAAYLNKPARLVRESYCAPSGQRRVLAQADDGRCIFWNRLCTIHPVKPRMCRMWPFIPALLVDVANWQIMADSCPGMRRDVNLHSLRRYLADVCRLHADKSRLSNS